VIYIYGAVITGCLCNGAIILFFYLFSHRVYKLTVLGSSLNYVSDAVSQVFFPILSGYFSLLLDYSYSSCEQHDYVIRISFCYEFERFMS
jgi:hypothetical protein